MAEPLPACEASLRAATNLPTEDRHDADGRQGRPSEALTLFSSPGINEQGRLEVLHDRLFFQRPEVASAHIMQGSAIDTTASGRPLDHWKTSEPNLKAEWQRRLGRLLSEYVELLGWQVADLASDRTEAHPECDVPGAKADIRPDEGWAPCLVHDLHLPMGQLRVGLTSTHVTPFAAGSSFVAARAALLAKLQPWCVLCCRDPASLMPAGTTWRSRFNAASSSWR